MTSYAAGNEPQTIVAADFNNDGKLDLATTAGNAAGRVSVRLGDGAGGFGTAQEFNTGWWEISSLAVADFNNDTKLDIAADHLNGVSILMGNGDGTFQSTVTTLSGDFSDVAVGDFNNDSNIDVVTTWLNGDWMRQYTPWWGDGQGGFVHQWGSDLPAEGGLAAVDLNNDGRLDVAIADGQVLLGTFQFDYGQQPLLNVRYDAAVAAGDFTGEGNADLVVAGDGVLAVLRGRGDGGFLSPIFHSANGTVHTAVATADFNADGKLDAVVTNGDAGTVSVMLGNGDGTLRYAGAFDTGASPAAVTVGDFNGDGLPDVAVANRVPGTISVLLNDGVWDQPSPSPPPSISVSDATVTEGNTGALNVTFTLALSKAAAVEVTVQYATADITAVAGSDYVVASGTVIIPAGQTSRTFTIAVIGDRLAEPTETFAVNLTSATNATISDGLGIGTILDDEPRISISDVTKSEGNGKKTTLFTFTVTLSAAYDQAVTMSYRTVNGTATTADGDYIAKSGTLTFAPGETTKTITIEVKADNKKEADESFYLDLFNNSSNSLITKFRGIGTILNDD